MAEPRDENPIDKPRPNERDQASDAAVTPHEVEHDDAVGRGSEDVDPDSAESDVDRDDTLDE